MGARRIQALLQRWPLRLKGRKFSLPHLARARRKRRNDHSRPMELSVNGTFA